LYAVLEDANNDNSSLDPASSKVVDNSPPSGHLHCSKYPNSLHLTYFYLTELQLDDNDILALLNDAANEEIMNLVYVLVSFFAIYQNLLVPTSLL
jgi:hypothetical protein